MVLDLLTLPSPPPTLLQHLATLLRKTCTTAALHRLASRRDTSHFLLFGFFFFTSLLYTTTLLTEWITTASPLPPSQFTSPLSSASGWVLIHAKAHVAAHPLQSARYLSSSLC